MGKIDWVGQVADEILKVLEESPSYRFPTIRSMYYYLSDSLKIIPATEQGYKKLDELLVKMRKDGRIEFGTFRVERGRSSAVPRYSSPSSTVELGFNFAKMAGHRFSIPKYWGQPILVEAWCEKKGLLPSVEHFVGDRVTVRSPEGFSPWEFMNDAVGSMESFMRERVNPKVVILYFGDQDPSGIQIYDSIIDQMEHFGLDFEVHRCGVTPEQIKKYGLPTVPGGSEAMAKIKRDSRYKKYYARFGEVCTELDSFIGLYPEAFKETIETWMDKYFDKESWETRKDKSDEIQKALIKAIGEYESEIEELRDNVMSRYRTLSENIDFEPYYRPFDWRSDDTTLDIDTSEDDE